MSGHDEDAPARVDVTVGDRTVRVEGSEAFVERHLPTLLDRLGVPPAEEDRQDAERRASVPNGGSAAGGESTGEADSASTLSPATSGSETDGTADTDPNGDLPVDAAENGDDDPAGSEATSGDSPSRTDDGESNRAADDDPAARDIESVAAELGIDPAALAEHVTIADGKVVLSEAIKSEPRYALLGFCAVESIRTGETAFGLSQTKERLIEVEGVEIEHWGDFLYRARERGDIRVAPETSKPLKNPFGLTGEGRERFVEWVEE